MMNNLFKSALQGVVQRMATQENLQTTLQFVQEKFVKEVPRSDARSKVLTIFIQYTEITMSIFR